MKIWELNREEGRTYTAIGEFDGTSVEYVVKADSVGNLRCKDMSKIEEKLALNRILEMEFEEVIDWNKIPVDTKVLVNNDNGVVWDKRYFKEYKDGFFIVFSDGKTSWTGSYTTMYKVCKLAKE